MMILYKIEIMLRKWSTKISLSRWEVALCSSCCTLAKIYVLFWHADWENCPTFHSKYWELHLQYISHVAKRNTCSDNIKTTSSNRQAKLCMKTQRNHDFCALQPINHNSNRNWKPQLESTMKWVLLATCHIMCYMAKIQQNYWNVPYTILQLACKWLSKPMLHSKTTPCVTQTRYPLQSNNRP